MKRFEVNGLYSMRSICNQECVWQYIVTARTACTVTLKSVEGKASKVIKCNRLSAGSVQHGPGAECALIATAGAKAPANKANREEKTT